MLASRDSQRAKVYKWEDRFFKQYGVVLVPFDDIQDIVNWVWHSEGLKKPPKVLPLPKRATKTAAQQGLYGLEFPSTRRKTHVIFHEVAHRMNQLPDGEYRGAYHGRAFMGLYMQLLHRYLLVPMPALIVRAKKSTLTFNLKTIPVQKVLELERQRKKTR